MNKSDQEIRMQQKHIFKCFELPFLLIAKSKWYCSRSLIRPVEQALFMVQSKGHVGLGNSC